jgi:hypothetical protein
MSSPAPSAPRALARARCPQRSRTRGRTRGDNRHTPLRLGTPQGLGRRGDLLLLAASPSRRARSPAAEHHAAHHAPRRPDAAAAWPATTSQPARTHARPSLARSPKRPRGVVRHTPHRPLTEIRISSISPLFAARALAGASPCFARGGPMPSSLKPTWGAFELSAGTHPLRLGTPQGRGRRGDPFRLATSTSPSST